MKLMFLRVWCILVFSGAWLRADDVASSLTLDGVQIQHVLDDSRKLFEGGDTDKQAEESLRGINSSKPNSAQWHMEYVANLLRIAFACKESNDSKTAQRIAGRVLVHLDQAERLFAGDADSLSSVHELRGVVREHLLGDTSQAVQSYQAALQQKPDNDSAGHRVRLLRGSDQSANK